MQNIFTINNEQESMALRNKAVSLALPFDIKVINSIIAKILKVIEAKGKVAGLAATQIGINKRIMICNYTKNGNLEVLINPKYIPDQNTLEYGWEGCFSVPLTFAKVARWKTINIEYYTPKGNLIKKQLSGFHARIYQHEYDHLDGVLIIDRGIEFKTVDSEDAYKSFLQTTITQ